MASEGRPYKTKKVADTKSPQGCPRYGLAGDGFGEVLVAHGGAGLEEAAGGEEFGVEQGGTGSSAD